MIGNLTSSDLAPDLEPIRMVRCEACDGKGVRAQGPLAFPWMGECPNCEGSSQNPETDDERHERQTLETEAAREPKSIGLGLWRR